MENKELGSIEQQMVWRRLWDILPSPVPSQVSSHEAASKSAHVQVQRVSDPDKEEMNGEREN